jgi:Ca2+-binding EF-hand superfamily protein
MIFSESEAH